MTQAKTVSKNCDPGKAIHVGNLVLGRIALASGNITEAKFRLLEAGKTPGSAALNSFGPNMLLAKELLEKKESAVVIEYFDLCAKFWEDDFNQLNIWKAQVKKGKIPDFNGNLRLALEPMIDAEIMDIIRKVLKTENPPN